MAGALLGLLGSGISAAGAFGAAGAAGDIAALEKQIIEQQRLQMQLEADRRRLETVRSMQRARSLSLATAVSQGAQMGTALMGAYGQISGQGVNQIKAVNQNEQIGENIFDLNGQISDKKMDIANFQSMQAIGGGISSLGGAFSSAMKNSPGLFNGGSTGGSTQQPAQFQNQFQMPYWYNQMQSYNPYFRF